MNRAPRPAAALAGLLLLAGCEARRDAPRLTPTVKLLDVTFHSAALDRDMQYRVILPLRIPEGARLRAVYLLHGAGGSFRDWSSLTGVARFAEEGLALVMPQLDNSYCTNAAGRPRDRYEDYLVQDLVADVQSRFPVGTDRADRAVVGVSMGGYGAVKLALRHPERYGFAAGLSPALDVPTRPFSWRRVWQWWRHRTIFGPWRGSVERENDPYALARSADPARVPFLYLGCGAGEGLLAVNRRFAAELDARGLAHELRVTPGGHDWRQWNEQLESCFRSLREHAR